jgi:hypothetical protein
MNRKAGVYITVQMNLALNAFAFKNIFLIVGFFWKYPATQTARKHERTSAARVVLISRTRATSKTRNVRSMLVLAEIHGGQVIAHLARRITTSICIAESELSVVIVSPTLHGFIVKESACVALTSRNCRCRTTCSEIHGG